MNTSRVTTTLNYCRSAVAFFIPELFELAVEGYSHQDVSYSKTMKKKVHPFELYKRFYLVLSAHGDGQPTFLSL
jgi:hypothetical protein